MTSHLNSLPLFGRVDAFIENSHPASVARLVRMLRSVRRNLTLHEVNLAIESGKFIPLLELDYGDVEVFLDQLHVLIDFLAVNEAERFDR